MTTQTVVTNVTESELAVALGGTPTGHTGTVTVTCPADYDPAAITAADIVHDSAIVRTDNSSL
ncbi:MAG: hypothetical protein K1X95_06630 [Acidimicrobiia bacterium]|nr:hypothetical protein [Acidimicrobiia bacterium]